MLAKQMTRQTNRVCVRLASKSVKHASVGGCVARLSRLNRVEPSEHGTVGRYLACRSGHALSGGRTVRVIVRVCSASRLLHQGQK